MIALALPGRCVHEVVAEQARARPGAVAVCQGAWSVSYGELDRWAQALAGELVAGGWGDGQVVGVCMRRSPLAVAAALGVLRAGGVYLPLDPRLPRARLEFMVADAGAVAVVGEQELRGAGFGVAWVDIA